jgi:hypothetical protein
MKRTKQYPRVTSKALKKKRQLELLDTAVIKRTKERGGKHIFKTEPSYRAH